MSGNPYSLASDDYLIAIALKRDSLTDLEQELVKRLDAVLVEKKDRDFQRWWFNSHIGVKSWT